MKKNIWLRVILILAAALIYFKIGDAGMIGDDAIYSMRAIGRLDYMFANQQSTPLQWFDKMPWWAGLSYHDAPPLILFIQHLFLSVHDSIFFAKLPTTLFALGSIILTYLWIKKLYSEKLANYAAAFLAFNSLFLWVARVSYLEMGVIFFYSLAMYLFTLALENKKYWIYFGAATGLLMLTKYTAVFFLPTIFIYLLTKKRELFRIKEIYFSLAAFFFFVSPVVVYNLMMFKTTGHFDLQFSRLLGQSSPWHLSGLGGGYLQNLPRLFFVLVENMAYLYVFIGLAGFILACLNYKKFILPILAFIFLTLEFVVSGPETHYVSIFTPFWAFFAALFFTELQNKISLKEKLAHKVALVVLVYLFIFSASTHWIAAPKGVVGIFHGATTIGMPRGIAELDNYLNSFINEKYISNRIDLYQELKKKDSNLEKYLLSQSTETSLNPAIIYDYNMQWFTRMWLFERRRFYKNLPLISSLEFSQLPENIRGGIKKAYFIKSTEFGALDQKDYWSSDSQKLENLAISQGSSVEEVRRSDGKVAYKIYEISFN